MLLLDTAFEAHYSIAQLAKLWNISRETVRLLVKDEEAVIKIALGKKRKMCRYSIPESTARRIHTKLFYPPTKVA
jgi:hypothetical protein